MPEQVRPEIGDLYPHLSGAEQQEAKENLDRYIGVVLRIHERIQRDPRAYAEFQDLTDRRRRSTMGPQQGRLP